MDPVIIGCDGCGSRIRVRHPDLPRKRYCPRCRTSLDQPLSKVRAQQSATTTQSPDSGLLGPAVDASNREQRSVATTFLADVKAIASPNAYAASLLFLTITASLFAEALGSLGADEPGYEYQVPARTTKSREYPGIGTSQHERMNSHPTFTTVQGETATPSTPIELPEDVFAPASAQPDMGAGRVVHQCGQVTPASIPPTPASRGRNPERIKIRDRSGRVMVARLHGEQDGQPRFILPDGQLGIPTRLIPTDEPFRPLTRDELYELLKEEQFSDFDSFKTTHYLIYFQGKSESSRKFAERSGALLENLYNGLTETFRKRGIPIHELEFPLVVVIFESEREFRAHKKVAPDVQAYYEIYTNRIHFYETSDRDHLAPELATLRRPQTVAHEGTHQILANIGVQPRLGAWPIWLTEGLAEYCAAPVQDKQGNATWNGLGMINALHMATIRDLEDPHSMQVKSRHEHTSRTGRDPGKPLLESLIRADHLSPTDYALAWALTHYLALKRGDDFVKFLIEMGKLPPLEPRTADQQVAAFKKSFGDDLAKLDKQIAGYLVKLARQKGYDHLPYYAVKFEQPFGNGMVRRAAMVSQSPSMIQQWIQEVSSPRGAAPSWDVNAHLSRHQALKAAESFMHGY